jgi:hypothetical protein
MNVNGGTYTTSGVNLPATSALGGWKTSRVKGAEHD